MQVLLNHVVPADLPAATVLQAVEAASPAPATAPSAIGLTLDFSVVDGEVVITPEGTDIMSRVLIADVETCVGTVHIVDMVLVPSSDGAMAPESARAVDLGGAYGDEEEEVIPSDTAEVVAAAPVEAVEDVEVPEYEPVDIEPDTAVVAAEADAPEEYEVEEYHYSEVDQELPVEAAEEDTDAEYPSDIEITPDAK